ncbi:phage tail protein [Microvirgula aerodenitrificans]|uniref:phage tail protein n=1 Tax=Microvirgula aerodenitrificans TaxID=57480 RepID=UPI002F421F4A
MQDVMHPIDTPDRRFHDGDPATGGLGTIVTATFMNQVQDCVGSLQTEAAAILSAAGMRPDPARNEQWLQAMQALFLSKMGKAADSDLLDGYDASYFARASDLGSAGLTPGQMVATFSPVPMARTLACDGAAVSRTTYARLFAAIGTRYGTGDGIDTFNLPNVPDGYALLAGTSAAVGAATSGLLIAHAHTASTTVAGNHSHGAVTSVAGEHSHTVRGYSNEDSDYGGQVAAGGGNNTSNPVTTPAGGHTHTIPADGNHTHSVVVDPTGGSANLAAGIRLLICIAY